MIIWRCAPRRRRMAWMETGWSGKGLHAHRLSQPRLASSYDRHSRRLHADPPDDAFPDHGSRLLRPFLTTPGGLAARPPEVWRPLAGLARTRSDTPKGEDCRRGYDVDQLRVLLVRHLAAGNARGHRRGGHDPASHLRRDAARATIRMKPGQAVRRSVDAVPVAGQRECVLPEAARRHRQSRRRHQSWSR